MIQFNIQFNIISQKFNSKNYLIQNNLRKFNSKNYSIKKFQKNSIQKIIQFNKWGSTDIG